MDIIHKAGMRKFQLVLTNEEGYDIALQRTLGQRKCLLLLGVRLKSPNSKVPINSGKRMLAPLGVGFAVVLVQVFGDTEA